MRPFYAILIILILTGTAFGGRAQPLPEFESGYELPETTKPPPADSIRGYIDVALLAAAILLSAYLSLRKRSRRYMLGLTAACLVYFGFIRQGCVCPVGAIQNFTLTFSDAAYVLPLTAAAFFLLPLFAALFFGRVFCASVCPLGAIQELVLLRPVRIPRWLEHGLGMLRYVYLGLAILFVAAGGTFLICRFDPFVGLFRFSASIPMLIFGFAMVGLSTFIGRPYCRFLCPYSVPLKFLSSVSKWHVSITPDDCVQCKLCENACPYGAIRTPTAEPASRTIGKPVLVILLAVLPLVIALGGLTGRLVSGGLANTDATIRKADAVWRFERNEDTVVTGDNEDIDIPDEVEAFYTTDRASEELFAEAEQARQRWHFGGWIFGIFIGLAVGGKLIALSVRRSRSTYEADRADCLSCARCFSSCPREQLRLKDSQK